MGEARRRGTYEDRMAAAIAKRGERKAREPGNVRGTPGLGKLLMATAMAAAMAASHQGRRSIGRDLASLSGGLSTSAGPSSD